MLFIFYRSTFWYRLLPIILVGLGLTPAVAYGKVNPRCTFSDISMSFMGTAIKQARCLLTPVRPKGILGHSLDELPIELEQLVGSNVVLQSGRLEDYLERSGIVEASIGGSLDEPLSITIGEYPAAYFVIHDTSSPVFGKNHFPDDLDDLHSVNDLSVYRGGGAHLFINRQGNTRLIKSFAISSRATKLEKQVLGNRSKGRFLHVELVQPRRRHDPDKRYESVAPIPGFTTQQYKQLALTYIAASVRGGAWLIPAYHRLVDDGLGLKNKAGKMIHPHDDPQSFDLYEFSSQIGQILEALE